VRPRTCVNSFSSPRERFVGQRQDCYFFIGPSVDFLSCAALTLKPDVRYCRIVIGPIRSHGNDRHRESALVRNRSRFGSNIVFEAAC
jgi:hypothetical protein